MKMSSGPEEVFQGTGLDSTTNVGQMEQYSLERKERLKLLKRKFVSKDTDKQDTDSVPK